MLLQSIVVYLCVTLNHVGTPLECSEINATFAPLAPPTVGLAIDFNPTDYTLLVSNKFDGPREPIRDAYMIAVIIHELAHIKNFKAKTTDSHGPNFVATCEAMIAAAGLPPIACGPVIHLPNLAPPP